MYQLINSSQFLKTLSCKIVPNVFRFLRESRKDAKQKSTSLFKVFNFAMFSKVVVVKEN
jgi:hypothetical protein